MKHLLRISLLLGLFTVFPASADDTKTKKSLRSFEIPYRVAETKHVLIRIKLNGKGPFNFLVDTGAPAMIISDKLAAKTGAKPDEDGWDKYVLEIEGGIKIPDAKGYSTDMFQLRGMNALGIAGCELHGVIGYNILARYKIEYDFTKDRLIWTELNFTPPDLFRISGKGGSQGGNLEMMGDIMKFMAPLMGIKPNFEIQPRGQVGIEVEERDDKLFIKSVLPGSAAQKAELKVGDRILTARKKPISSLEDFHKAIAKLGIGDKLAVTVKRGDETVEASLILGKGF
jgi:serine protease DegQ